MKTVSDAQRDSQRVWSYLDRLFDWAGNRSKPMPPSDLLEIRAQVTENMNRLAQRADDLERAPLLRSVEVAPDGNRTVTIDMRDGTTRKFQTRADWFDDSPTLGDPVSVEVLELRERLMRQIALTTEEAQRSTELRESLVSRDAQLAAAERLLTAERERKEGPGAEEVDALVREVEERLEARIATLEAERDEWQERYTTATETMDGIENGVKSIRETMATEIVRLEVDRDEWKKRYTTAASVIDEALPAISDLLAEKTKELEDERRGIGGPQ